MTITRMTLTTTQTIAALLLGAAANVAVACDLPPLVVIPAKGDIGDKGPQIQTEVQKYYDAMRTYSQCVQAELTAAGGDSAPTLTKAVLVQRNNAAVAEVQTVVKVFQDSVGAAPGAAPPAAGNEGGGRRRDR